MSTASVVIVTHNSAAYLSDCLGAITERPLSEVIVVDNASSDDTLAVARRFETRIQLIANPQNLGFAAAVNQGHRLSHAPILVLLNPDTIASPGALEQMLSALVNPSVAAAAGALLDVNGAPQRGFQFRRFPTLTAMLCEVLLVNRVWPGNPWSARYRCLDVDDSQPQFVEQPAGACLAVRRDVWESLGGFDESFYPVWFEDVDFCRRLADRGWKIAYLPEARFSHAGGHSVSKLPFSDRQVFWYSNMARYFSKHHGWFKAGILRVGILAGLALRSLLSLVGLGPEGVSMKEAVKGYAHAARAVWRPSDSAGCSKQSRVGVAAI